MKFSSAVSAFDGGFAADGVDRGVGVFEVGQTCVMVPVTLLFMFK